MTRGKRNQTPKLAVKLLREGITESEHKVDAVVSDNRNRTRLLAGNGEKSSFARSALKPFQALAVSSSGVLERFDLTEKDLAIICSSHQGNIEQARQVFNILWRSDIAPTLLQCPIPAGKNSPLQNNCSGKHAGMLAVCQQRNWSLNGYLQRSHPIQELILNQVAELLSIPGAELIQARDDCGAPTYSMQLQQMAYLYALLASGNSLALERVVRAMTHYPEMVSGKNNFDTELMLRTKGSIVSKSGAEGIQCIGLVGEGMGLAIKVADGSKRAKYAAAITVLKQMGWISPDIAEELTEQFMNLSKYKRLEVIGELTVI